MTERNRDRLAFALGILAGAALGYYLASDEGRELRKRIQQRVGELGEELGSMTNDQINNLVSGMESILAKGKSYAEDLGESILAKAQAAQDAVQETPAGTGETFEPAAAGSAGGSASHHES